VKDSVIEDYVDIDLNAFPNELSNKRILAMHIFES
jgi:hypothetical protein